ncbi:MAG: hypothetical protein WB566_11975, partial [Terriglobales bacterium]
HGSTLLSGLKALQPGYSAEAPNCRGQELISLRGKAKWATDSAGTVRLAMGRAARKNLFTS